MHKVKVNPTAEIVAEDIGRIGEYKEEAFGYVLEDFLIDEGVVSGLEVIPTATPSMGVSILPGRIYQDRRQGQQDEELTPPLVIVSNTSSFPRIDRVIARYQAVEDEPELRNYLVDVVTRQVNKQEFKTRIRGGIAYQILEGTPSPIPAPPSVPEGWLPLAQVKVGAGAVQILEADILDERQLPVRLSQHNHDGRYSKPDHKHNIEDVQGLELRLPTIAKPEHAGKVWAVNEDGTQTGWKNAESGYIGKIEFPTYIVQPNHLKLNGAELSRTAYAKLWEWAQQNDLVVSEAEWQILDPSVVLQVKSAFFSSGNGSTTFRLPDHRGLFYRVLDEGRGVDSEPARLMGSLQGDAIRNIIGSFGVLHHGSFPANGPFSFAAYTGKAATSGGSTWYEGPLTMDLSKATKTATENRVRNIGLFATIQYK